VTSSSDELIRETMYFPVTYLVEDRWAAGVCTLRQPVSLPDGFGEPSMSFFLYNQDAHQAIARPFLKGAPPKAQLGPAPLSDMSAMPRYHQFDNWDAQSNAPSHNFIYDFDVYRFHVRSGWREVLRHDSQGHVESGSIDALADAFAAGLDVKAGISGLCDDLSAPGGKREHTVFVNTIACYYYTQQKLFIAASQPLVRVRPDVPLKYTSGGWDFGWVMVRSDGFVSRRLFNPYTLEPIGGEDRCAVRWFVR
jgi:hypothetical protein